MISKSARALPDFLKNVYLIYIHRGVIRIKNGDLKQNGLFVPYTGTSYNCGLRVGNRLAKPMELVGQKIWVLDSDDIPRAVEKISQRRETYITEVQERAQKAQAQYLSCKCMIKAEEAKE